MDIGSDIASAAVPSAEPNTSPIQTATTTPADR